MKPQPRPDCPTPHKKAYTDEQVFKKALNSSRVWGKPFRTYACRCGYQHLTSRVIPNKKAV